MSKKYEKISVKIKDLIIEEDKLIIQSDKDNYYADIKKGSICCDILTVDKKKVLPLSYLEIDDLIILKTFGNKIKKIYINLKYSFISDSEDDDYLSD